MAIQLVVIAGTRAQFINVASFQRGIKEWNKQHNLQFKSFYIDTGQHYDASLSDDIIKDLEINFEQRYKYDYTNPTKILAQMIVNLNQALQDLQTSIDIDWVVIFGDTNSALAGVIAATNVNLPILHVEAGLRTWDPNSPEELNRIVIDHLSTINFASAQNDIVNLEKEKITRAISWTGDLLYDLAKSVSQAPSLQEHTDQQNYILASLHRKENLNDKEMLQSFFLCLGEQKRQVLFLTHPRTLLSLNKLAIPQNIILVPPIPYTELISKIKNCVYIITDSGGLQREAYYLNKRCLVRQDHPFWQCLIDAKVHKKIGRSYESIKAGIAWIDEEAKTDFLPFVEDLGDGTAVQKILDYLVEYIV